jgi:hypothetical protein
MKVVKAPAPVPEDAWIGLYDCLACGAVIEFDHEDAWIFAVAVFGIEEPQVVHLSTPCPHCQIGRRFTRQDGQKLTKG